MTKPVPFSGDCRGCGRSITFKHTDYNQGNPPPFVRFRCQCGTTNALEKEI